MAILCAHLLRSFLKIVSVPHLLTLFLGVHFLSQIGVISLAMLSLFLPQGHQIGFPLGQSWEIVGRLIFIVSDYEVLRPYPQLCGQLLLQPLLLLPLPPFLPRLLLRLFLPLLRRPLHQLSRPYPPLCHPLLLRLPCHPPLPYQRLERQAQPDQPPP